MRWAGLILTAMALTCSMASRTALGHPALFTTLQVTVGAGGEFRGSMNIDILAFALGETSADATNEEMQALLDGPRAELGRQLADAGERFKRELVVKTDAGNVVPTGWYLPDLTEVNEVLARKIRPAIVMPGEIDFSGTLPATARVLSVRLPYVLGDTLQVYEMPNGDSAAEQVSAGAYSPSMKLPSPAARTEPMAAGEAGPRRSGTGAKVVKAAGCALLVAGVFLIANRVMKLKGTGGCGGV